MPLEDYNESLQLRALRRQPAKARGPVLSRLMRTPGLGAWAVLVCGLLITAVLTMQYERIQNRADLFEFHDSVDSMTAMIQGRLRSYTTVLHATAGLFEGSEEVTPEELRVFISRLRLETFYAGVLSIGHVARVRPEELEELAALLGSYPESGYHNFRFALTEGFDEHLIVTHIEPQIERFYGAIGYDLVGDPHRREAMMRAAELDSAAATPALTLLPATDPEDELGVIVYVPVHKDGEVAGFVFASFSTSAVLSVLLEAYPGVHFAVYDGQQTNSENILFHSSEREADGRHLTGRRAIALAGRTWTIVYSRPMRPDLWLPTVPIAGMLVSLLIAVSFWRLARARLEAADRAEQLRDQREWFAVTLASIGDAVVATDATGRVTFMNERAQKMTGWNMDDAFGRACSEVMPLADEQTGRSVPSPVVAVLEQRADVALPAGTVLVRRDGSRIPIDDIGSPIRGTGAPRDGEIIGAVITFRDISERRRNERALQESQARLQFTLNSAHVGDWDMDIATGQTRRSIQHDQAFGYDHPVDEWDFEKFMEHLHPDDRAEVRRCFERSFTTGDDCDVECRIIWPDNSEHWIEVHGSIYQHDKGRPARMLGLVQDITERKKIEEELRRSEKRFRSLVTATSSIIWTANMDGAIGSNLKSWEDFTGQAPEQYFGMGWVDALHPDDREDVAEAWAEAIRTKTPFQFRYRLYHQSGEYRRVEARGVPILNEHGEIAEWVGSISDIEEQQRVAEALLVAEQRFRWIIDSAVDFAIFTFDVDGKIDSWNPGAERVLGYSEPEIIGKDVSIIFSPKDRAGDRPAIEREEALSGTAGMDERWHIRADGELFFAAGRVMTLKDDRGKVHGFVKILHDRTSEKRAQEALQRRTDELQISEKRFRSMADSAPVFIWMADTSKQFIWVNKPWLDYTGRSLDEQLGTGWTEGIHPDDRDESMKIYSEKFDAHEPIRLKYRFRRKNGEYRWLLDHGVPLHGPDGTFAGYIGSCIDITELEQARETLERHREDLERLVDERTAKLRETNEQLRLSERMASLGTLAAGIGHDLGNLLLPMRIRMDMIEQHLPESQRDSIRVIRTSAEYLANLAKGLRYLSMDTDRAESAGGSTDLYAWWEEAMPLLHNSLPKNVTLEREFAENLPEVGVSPSALTQAIFNLVQNSGTALRERSSGSVLVWTRLDERPNAKSNFVQVGVTDDGPGMDPEVRRRCLEPFFSTKTREFSTGLGLSLVQGVVQRAGGKMAIESEQGKGTTIVLNLPAARSMDHATGDNGRHLQAAVLVDDARLRAFITAELKSMGYEIAVERTLTHLRAGNATLWVLDVVPLTEGGATDRTRLDEFAKLLEDIVEEDSDRMVVVLRQPEEWANRLADSNERVFGTSSGFKPSEIREALRLAARQSADRTELTHDHGEHEH